MDMILLDRTRMGRSYCLACIGQAIFGTLRFPFSIR